MQVTIQAEIRKQQHGPKLRSLPGPGGWALSGGNSKFSPPGPNNCLWEIGLDLPTPFPTSQSVGGAFTLRCVMSDIGGEGVDLKGIWPTAEFSCLMINFYFILFYLVWGCSLTVLRNNSWLCTQELLLVVIGGPYGMPGMEFGCYIKQVLSQLNYPFSLSAACRNIPY